MDGEADVLEDRGAGQALEPQHLIAAAADPLWELVAPRTPDHFADDKVSVDPGIDVVGADHSAVLQDGDAVGDREDLAQAVGDVEYGDALRLQSTDDGEELFDLARPDHGRRLVEDQDPGVERERAGDLGDLARGGAQGADRLLDVEVEVEPAQHLGRVPVEPVPVDQAEPGARQAAEKQVLGHASTPGSA